MALTLEYYIFFGIRKLLFPSAKLKERSFEPQAQELFFPVEFFMKFDTLKQHQVKYWLARGDMAEWLLSRYNTGHQIIYSGQRPAFVHPNPHLRSRRSSMRVAVRYMRNDEYRMHWRWKINIETCHTQHLGSYTSVAVQTKKAYTHSHISRGLFRFTSVILKIWPHKEMGLKALPGDSTNSTP